MTAARVIAISLVWGLLTTLAAWTIGPRSDNPGPLEVLTVQPAHAGVGASTPSDVGDAIQRAQTIHADNVRLLQAAALEEAARRAQVTTVVRRAAPRPTTTQPAPVVASGPVPDGCMTGTRKTRAESDRCWTPLLAAYPWPVSTMQDIVWCESGGDESAINSIFATGLLQLYNGLGYAWPGGTDPVKNIADGYNVKYLSQGLGAWSASSGCW